MKLDVRLYQDEDGIWIAEIPAIPGCGSDGKTREEAVANVRDAAELCISVRRDLDLPLIVETATVDVAAQVLGKLPVVSGDETRRALEAAGWIFQRENGSHMVLTKPGSILTLAVPRHREIAAGTLRRVLRDAGLSVEEFVDLLKQNGASFRQKGLLLGVGWTQRL